MNVKMKITALLFLQLLAMTVEDRNHQPSVIKDQEEKRSPLLVPEDKTEDQVKNIFNLFELFHEQTIKKSHADWVSQHRQFRIPSEIINSKNITFTKFIPDEEILPISYLKDIKCEFKRKLKVQFHQQKNMNIEGDANLLYMGNISSCRIFFNFNLTVTIEFAMENLDKMAYKLEKLAFHDFTDNKISDFKITELEGNWCQKDIMNAVRKQMPNDTFQAIEDVVKERLKIAAESVFKSISNKCLQYAQLNENHENYAHFKLEPNSDFPWNSDYNEMNITGLNNFASLKAEYSNCSETRYSIFVYEVNIRWEIMSVTTKISNFDTNSVEIDAYIKEPSMGSMKIDLKDVVEKENYNHITLDDTYDRGAAYAKMLGTGDPPDWIWISIQTLFEPDSEAKIEVDVEEHNFLVKFIVAGIERIFQNIRYDGTAEFTNTFRRILAPFDKKILENLLNDLEEKPLKKSSIWFSKIEMETYSNLENIICATCNDNKMMGTISYKNIKGQANFDYYVGNVNGYRVGEVEPAQIHIKQVNFNISLQRNPNQKNEITVQIKDNFKVADTMISFENDLRREIRIATGTQIFEDFVKLFRDRINNTMNSVFRPVFDTCACDVSSGNTTDLSSNYFADSRQYFSFYRQIWANYNDLSITHFAAVVMNGMWNFKHINARYVNENFTIDGLQLENVTGSIKFWNDGPQESIHTLDYAASYLFLEIGPAIHTWVNCVSFEVVSNARYSVPDTEVQYHLLQSFAFFIQRSVYGDLIRAHNRISVSESMRKTLQQDMPPMYDATSIFVNNIVKTLQSIPSDNNYHQQEKVNLQLIADDDSFISSSLPFQVLVNFELMKTYAEEICDDIDYSQNANSNYEQFNLFGNIVIQQENDGGRVLSRIPYTVNRYRSVKTSDHKNEDNYQFQIKIDSERMTIYGHFEPPIEDILKRKLTQIASDFARRRQNSFSLPPNICSNRLGSLAPKASKNDFYLITNTITDASQNFLTYHIKLHGLYSLKLFRFDLFDESSTIDVGFNLTATNLTAHITWNYCFENLIVLTPMKRELHIDQISFTGQIYNSAKRLSFTDSELLLRDEDGSTSTKFKKTLNTAIINSIMRSVKEKYLKD